MGEVIRGRGGEGGGGGAPQRGSGCDMKYSDGGGKIQLAPFFFNRAGLLPRSTWLWRVSEGGQEMVVIREEKVSESVIARKQGEEMRNSGANGRNGGEAAQSEQAGIVKRNKIRRRNSAIGQKEVSVEMSGKMGGEEGRIRLASKGASIPFDRERLRPKQVS